MHRLIILFFIIISVSKAFSQSAFAPIDALQYHRLERLEIKSGQLSNTFHTNIKPFERQDISNFLRSIGDSCMAKISKIDYANVIYLNNDNWEFSPYVNHTNVSKHPILNNFFKIKSDFYSANKPDYDIHISPIVGLGIGTDSQVGTLAAKQVFNETRGFEMRARISKKLGIYTMATENVVNNPNYVVNYYAKYGGLPYQAFIKLKNDDAKLLQTDFYNATGYITFDPIKNLNLTFGNDRNFIGSGIRSLVMSDFSAPFFQLKSTLKIGKFQYMSIMGRMVNKQIPDQYNVSYPPKFINFHHLNVNVAKNLNVGIYEVVMFGKRNYGFELAYLNPVIFSRYVEGYLGSADNSIIGVDFKWNLFKRFSTYGQFYLDEYSKSEFAKYLWWSKKYAWQLGTKYIDVFGMKNLDFQVEYNYVRPYMYTHFSTYTNYVNYNLPIAHPLGANFKELLLVLRYQPLPKMFFTATYMHALQGDDIDGKNYGSNLLTDNTLNKPLLYGVKITQGYLNKIDMTNINLSYMLFHNFFIEANYTRRKDSYNLKPETIKSAGIRWNLPTQSMFF